MRLVLPEKKRNLPQVCSFKAEYLCTKTSPVMQIFNLVETLEITENVGVQTQIRRILV